jgi:hypothetical protein
MSKKLLVTGSSGLNGSEICVYFARELSFTVQGVDNPTFKLSRSRTCGDEAKLLALP